MSKDKFKQALDAVAKLATVWNPDDSGLLRAKAISASVVTFPDSLSCAS
ncbi:hypothetical protein [Ramlibacter sp.]|nr:hypothetical protein [Ramlibacter sp.]MDB5957908.1 hypothetical protein [Ramlibacter sp.]